MTEQLISLIGGTTTGFLFKYWAQRAQDQKEIFQQNAQGEYSNY